MPSSPLGTALGCLALLTLGMGLGARPQAPLAEGPRRVETARMAATLPATLAEVRLVAVGDIMMHGDVKLSASLDTRGLAGLWDDVSPLFKGADIALGNLETPVAPRTGAPGRPYLFNAPPELPAVLRESGFSVLVLANNHAFDQGNKGLRETLEHLQAAGIPGIGAGADQKAAETPLILERKGLKVAFLAFTDIFNADLNRKATEPWVRSLDANAAVEAVKRARTQADAVVLSVHWGNEDIHAPTVRQKDMARQLVAAGADLIIGHHPHVLQPAEWLEAGGRKGLVAYSLGNFVSNQDRYYQADLFPVAKGDCRDGAALQARLVLERQPDGQRRLRVEDVVFEPLWTENNWQAQRKNAKLPRRIRVIQVDAALQRVWAELEGLREAAREAGRDPKTMKDAILAKQEELRTLLLRKKRVAEIVGQAFVTP